MDRDPHWQSDEQAVRVILNTWDPIPGSPDDEYDCLVHRVLSVLHQNGTDQEVRHVMTVELSKHFGIDVPSFEIEGVSEQIWRWWTRRIQDSTDGSG